MDNPKEIPEKILKEKNALNDFRLSIKEIYGYLLDPQNKVAGLLLPEYKEKYDNPGFWRF